MLWDEKVEEWLQNEVTKAFFKEMMEDRDSLMATLVFTTLSQEDIYTVRGMIRAIQAVLDAPTKDKIKPLEEEE